MTATVAGFLCGGRGVDCGAAVGNRGWLGEGRSRCRVSSIPPELGRRRTPAVAHDRSARKDAKDREHAAKAVTACAQQYGARFPKAVKKITGDEDELLAFYDYPAEHWVHLRTTNPLESTFASVRLRTNTTEGAGSPAAALAMVFKLVEVTRAC